MRIEDITHVNELGNLLNTAQFHLTRMERMVGYGSPTSIIFCSDCEQVLIGEDDLDAGVWHMAIEVIIDNLKDQIERYKEGIRTL